MKIGKIVTIESLCFLVLITLQTASFWELKSIFCDPFTIKIW
jgi:hypothetical protein